MRNALIIWVILTFNPLFSCAQSPTWISSYYYSYTELSVEFYTTTVKNSSFNYKSTLEQAQSRYDAAHQEVSSVYSQMSNLQLLNKINREYLNSYRDKYFRYIAETAGKIDLSKSENKDWAISSFRAPVTNNKYIRNEIKIQNRIAKEIDFIEHTAPKMDKEQVGDLTQKKKNISGFLEEFENADPAKSQELLKKYGLDLIMFGDFLEN